MDDTDVTTDDGVCVPDCDGRNAATMVAMVHVATAVPERLARMDLSMYPRIRKGLLW